LLAFTLLLQLRAAALLSLAGGPLSAVVRGVDRQAVWGRMAPSAAIGSFPIFAPGRQTALSSPPLASASAGVASPGSSLLPAPARTALQGKGRWGQLGICKGAAGAAAPRCGAALLARDTGRKRGDSPTWGCVSGTNSLARCLLMAR